jgi:hypothetical protein
LRAKGFATTTTILLNHHLSIKNTQIAGQTTDEETRLTGRARTELVTAKINQERGSISINWTLLFDHQ